MVPDFFRVDSPDMSDVRLPLFPLQTVLFPGGFLPLRIFEVRYLDLIARCHREEAPFGVVCMTQGSEVRQPPVEHSKAEENEFAPEAFHTVGTLATIVAYEKVQPGLVLVRCTGGKRFKLSNSEQLKHGLWVGDADWLVQDMAVSVPTDLVYVQLGLKKLVSHLLSSLGPDESAPFQTPFQWDDSGWLANRWCELLPISPQLKQQLMTLDNPLLRLELVADLLERLKIAPKSS
jgi:Lon protease-like protein